VTDTSNRRESLIQRCDFMREIIDQVSGLDQDSLLSKFEQSERDRLSNPRIASRLAMRRARKIVPAGMFSQSSDEREMMLLRGGCEAVELLTIMVGAHVLWDEIIRLVQRTEREALDNELGISSRAIALRGRQHNLGFITSNRGVMNLETLLSRIREEGALSWACWLAIRDPLSARRLRVFTPERVSNLITGGLPGTAKERSRRRSAVELEIDELMRAANGDLAQQEVA